MKADLRLISVKAFRSTYSVRFPRCVAVRFDKPWHDTLTDIELSGIATEAKAGVESSASPEGKKKAQQRKKHLVNMLPPAFSVPDLSSVEKLGDALAGMKLVFLNWPGGGDATTQKAKVWRWVKAHSATPMQPATDKANKEVRGTARHILRSQRASSLVRVGGTNCEWGQTAAALTPYENARLGMGRCTDLPQQSQVTHWVAEQRNGLPYDIRKGKNNVYIYKYSYLDACVAAGCLVSPLPKHVLHRPPAPAADPADCTLPLEDTFGDPYAVDVDAADVRELLYQVRELGRRMELAGRPAAGEMPS